MEKLSVLGLEIAFRDLEGSHLLTHSRELALQALNLGRQIHVHLLETLVVSSGGLELALQLQNSGL